MCTFRVEPMVDGAHLIWDQCLEISLSQILVASPAAARVWGKHRVPYNRWRRYTDVEKRYILRFEIRKRLIASLLPM